MKYLLDLFINMFLCVIIDFIVLFEDHFLILKTSVFDLYSVTVYFFMENDVKVEQPKTIKKKAAYSEQDGIPQVSFSSYFMPSSYAVCVCVAHQNISPW